MTGNASPHAKPERNAAIMADRQAGMTGPELAAKYGLSVERIWLIIRAEKGRALLQEARAEL